MKEQTHEMPEIVAAAERQMRAWSLNQEISDSSSRYHRPHHGLGEYITISRETGADGGEIAAMVGRMLGWEVLDKDIIDRIAERYHLPKDMLELVDETAYNWVHDMLGPWFDHRIVPHEKYVVYLTRLFLAAAKRGNVVLVGRGAQFLLPRNQGMSVRIVASERYRIARVMERCNMTESAARRYIRETDAGRRDFVLKYFRHDISDPHLFDMVVQVDRMGLPTAADEIVATYRRCFAPRPEPHEEGKTT